MMPEKFLDALLSLPTIPSRMFPLVSPDGKWVAWTWFRIGPVSDVYASPVNNSESPIRLSETDNDTYLVSITPDSRSVIVAQDQDGDERDQLFRIDLEKPLELVPLTEPDPNYYIRGGQLHPNGRWLIYGANLDIVSGKELEATWLYRHDLVTGERTPLAKPLKPSHITPKLNLQGSHVLYYRSDHHPAGNQTWVVDIAGKDDRELLNFGANVKTYASWHPDGEQILVMVETPTHRRLGLGNIDSKEISWIFDDASLDILTAFIPNNSNHIVVIRSDQGRQRSTLIDLSNNSIWIPPTLTGNLIPVAPVPLSTTLPKTLKGEIGETDWIGLYFSTQQPGEVIRFNPRDISPATHSSISRVWEHTKLTSTALHLAEDFNWKSVDGIAIHGWLYRTPVNAKGTIVYVHGGPTSHSQNALNAQIQFFVQRGFNVLDPNYRGSTGYGLPFREAIREDGWGGREQEDIHTGIEALIQRGIAKPGKVGITGTSYGGYSAWWAITHFPPEIISAAAPICGMTDLVVDYETTRPDLRPYSEEMMSGSPTQIPERYRQRSPVNFIENIRGHLLIVQGAHDPNVTPKNVSDVVSALEKARIPYEKLTFEDEGHGISKRENQRTLYLRLADFFERAFSS